MASKCNLPIEKHNEAGNFSRSPHSSQEPMCSYDTVASYILYNMCHGSLAATIAFAMLVLVCVAGGILAGRDFFPAASLLNVVQSVLVAGGATTGVSFSSS